ncbi:MAG: transcription antitermination factor NusB [bacterium]
MSLPSQRKKARSLLVQALYQWQLSGADISQIEAEFCVDNDMSKVDREFFHELLHSIPKQLSDIDALYEPLLDRKPGDLDPVSLAVLRVGTYELKQRIDVPYKVVINEAVNLAKKFGPTDAHKYINGIMDRVAAKLRQVEIAAVQQQQ